MTPDAREELRRQLVTDEGLVLHAYQDSLGYWTIGVGHLIDAKKGGQIPATIAYALLEHDIDAKARELETAFPWVSELDAVRYSVLLQLTFNMGAEGLAKFVNTLAAVQRGDYHAAADGMARSLWARQVQPSRSARLIEMMRSGHWPHKEPA